MSELTTIGSAAVASQAALTGNLACSLAATAHSDDKVAVAVQGAFGNTTDSRVYQAVSGDLQVASKPIGYIIGEQVIRPMIDGIAYVWSKMPSFSMPSASACTSAKPGGGSPTTGPWSGGTISSGGGRSGSSSGGKSSGGGGRSGGGSKGEL